MATASDGLSVVGVLVAIVILVGIFLLSGGSLRSLGILAADAGERVATAVGGGAQARTMRAMRAIAEANSRMRVERGRYAESLQELRRLGYGGFAPERDPWGNAWDYDGGATGWRLVSHGADGKPGPPPPRDWRMGNDASDLIMDSGVFVQAPKR